MNVQIYRSTFMLVQTRQEFTQTMKNDFTTTFFQIPILVNKSGWIFTYALSFFVSCFCFYNFQFYTIIFLHFAIQGSYIIIVPSVWLPTKWKWGKTDKFIRFVYITFISIVLRYGPCVTRRSHNFTCHPHTNHVVAAWLSGNGVAHINKVTLRRTRLVLGWVAVSGFISRCGTFISVCDQPPRSAHMY